MSHHHSEEENQREVGRKEAHGCCSSGKGGEGDGKGSGHGSGHGMWMMIACLLPLLIIGGVYLWSSGQSLQWTWLLILLCPLAHIFMMKGHK